MDSRKGPKRKDGMRVPVDPPLPIHGGLVVALQLNRRGEPIGRWIVPKAGGPECFELLADAAEG